MRPPMPDSNDVTHRDLWVAITTLGGKVDSILSLMAERKEEVSRLTRDLDALFSRQRLLEARLAQIVGVGLVLTVLIPVAATLAPLVIDHAERPAEVRK